MPLLNTVNIAGRNHTAFTDVFQADSAITSVVGQAGGEVNMNADFREQVMSVVRRTTVVTPVGEGVDKPVDDATVATPRFDVKKWPLFQPISEEMDRNEDPANLAMSIVNSAAMVLPKSYDAYYLDLIAAGAGITLQPFDPAAGVASLKGILEQYTATSYEADGIVLTRAGAVELGWNVDGDNRQMDLTNALNLPAAVTGAVLGLVDTDKTVLGVIGPWGQSKIPVAAGLSVTRMAEATIDGKGPRNGYVNYLTQMAAGFGNAQASTEALATTGAGFTVLHSATA